MPSRRALLGLAILVLGIAPRASSQGLRFDTERIVIHVAAGGLRVEGAYTFINDTSVDLPQRIYYPFPVDSLHPAVRDISVALADSTITYKESDQGILFAAPLPAGRSTTVHVAYTQECLDSTGCYILMTTSAWNMPLRVASFEVRVADGLELVESSYPLERAVAEDGAGVYRMTRRDFVPDRDLCVRWRPVGQ